MAKTISFVKGKGSMSHNNRKFIAENVDEKRVGWNEIYVATPVEEAYEICFGEALREYNEKQKRADRKKENYLEEIKHSKNGENVFYENVVQIGDMKDTSVLLADGSINPDAKVAAEVLREYVRTFGERNPNLYLFNAVLHMDEATPHLHLDYIPVAHGYSRGMKTRNSLTKALQEQGIPKALNNMRNETVMWQERERAYITELAQERGIEITVKGEKRASLTLPEYKEAMKEIGEIKEEIISNDKVIEEQKSRIVSFEKKHDDLVKRNKALGIMILSKEEVKKLPEPESTLMGDYYKVPKKDYNRLKATATQVEKIKKDYQKKEDEISKRAADLDKREKEIENKRKMPIMERMELNALRIFKSKVSEIVNMMPESKIKSLLQMALEEKEAPRNILTMERKKEKNIAI